MKFPKGDVLQDDYAIKQRRSDLEKALRLGNAEYQKVKIIFESDSGTMCTETTIWNLTENYVILKSNVDIPIRSIHEVELI